MPGPRSSAALLHPAQGEVWLRVRVPTVREAAIWRRGRQATFAAEQGRWIVGDDRGDPIRAGEDLLKALAAFDKARRAPEHFRRTLSGGLADWDRKQRQRQATEQASRNLKVAGAALNKYLEEGLLLRAAEPGTSPLAILTGGDPHVYAHLIARGCRSRSDLRVCEWCATVFEAATPRARLCEGCKGRRPVPLRPVTEGGHHIGYRRGARFELPEPGHPQAPRFFFRCEDCGATSESSNAGRTTCKNCGGNSGRQRKRRGNTVYGRQSFKFRSRGGQPVQAVSFADREGQTVRYDAVDGVIETRDAEHAAVLATLDLEPANEAAGKCRP